MPSPNSGLTVGQALALGVLQGPAELLPISSSAHTTAIPWLLGWRYSDLDPELRKSFEVALHAGGVVGMVIARRGEIWRWLDPRAWPVIAAASGPPAVVGVALERTIEARLGTPATIPAGLLAGSAMMVVADRAPGRRRREAGTRDGLWLGCAQSLALVPGISRAGATRSVARLLGFDARDAKRLSEQVGLPVLLGASLLKAIRLSRRGLEPGLAWAFAAGAAGSFASTLVFATLPPRRSRQQLLPYATYRIALAALMLKRLRAGSTVRRPRPARP